MDGPCPKDCNSPCADICKPVCAVSTKGEKQTFPYECKMYRWNCIHDTGMCTNNLILIEIHYK